MERGLEQLRDLFPEALQERRCQGKNRRTTHWLLTSRHGLLPEMLLNEHDLAMALSLLERQARSRLPQGVLERLTPYWEQARATAAHNVHTQRWQRDFQYLPDPLRPEPPSVDPDIQQAIEDALANEQLLKLHFDTLDGPRQLEGVFALRLLLLEEMLYLLAEHTQVEDPEESLALIPLYRVSRAEAQGLALGGRGLEPDLAQQYMLGTREAITLEMRVSRELAEALFQRPIGRGQIITPQGKHYRVTTLIVDSPQLRRWLRRRQDEAEVLAPIFS
ncbi:WYL domain-containing protein [Halomonas sp. Bachu 37]|uniref:WYL domain-containing protein n=1 Tax=Halomonas kashgarensis TaxID=3084920 RepID=UPI003217CF15